MYSNTTGSGNVAIGAFWDGSYIAPLNSNTIGQANVAIGSGALGSNTTNHSGTAVGVASLYSSTGMNNTALGRQSGYNLTTGTNNTFLGYNAQPSSATVSNTITFGDASITTLRAQVTSITALSDARDKKNIQPLGVGLDFVKTLNPVTFDWNMRDGGKVDVPDTGFIAQELMAAEDAVEMADKLQLTYRDNPEKLEATQGRLIPILVKAIQELAAEVELLKGAK
jgi:hypothetical protein